jgi:hypothetical protein
MDFEARYRMNPRRVEFEYVADAQVHFGAVTLDALAALSGEAVYGQEQAIAAYRRCWRPVHAAALGLRARGQHSHFVQSEDFDKRGPRLE